MSDSRETIDSRWVFPPTLWLTMRSWGFGRLLPAVTLAMVAAIAPLSAQTVVVRDVLDGDTVALSDGTILDLVGIDAPDLSQVYGKESKRWLEIAVIGRQVQLRNASNGKARLVWRNLDVNGYQIYVGAARVVTSQLHKPEWVQYQQVARAKRRGMWGQHVQTSTTFRHVPQFTNPPQVSSPTVYCLPGGT